MKSSSFKILILIFWFTISVVTCSAQPNWGLNPQDYEFSMTITGKVTTNGYFSVNENDLVAAFANGECRGITNLKYEKFMDGYFAYLMVFSNTPIEEITFKIFNASENEIVSTKDTINFTINQIVGSLNVPYIFSSNLLNSEARLLSFEIPDQVGETLIVNHNFYLKRDLNSTLTEIKAEFSTSTGAKVYVNGVPQFSGTTINDFTVPVHYMVISADMSDTVVYKVRVSVGENDPPKLIGIPPKFVLQGEMYIYSILVNDDKGVELSLEGLPSWLTYNPKSNLISGFAGNDDVGDYSFTIKASNGFMETVQNVIVSVININDAPEINYYIEDQFFFIDRENEIQLPFGCLSDPDEGDSITFELASDNNSALPHWMNFNPETFVISGNPPKGTDEKLSLKLTATDKGKLKEWIVFRIYVVSNPTSVNDLEDNQIIRCYPNPVKDQLQIDIPRGNEKVKVSIVNLEGLILKNMVINDRSQNIIPFEGAPGMYFIHFQQGKYQQIEKIIKQ